MHEVWQSSLSGDRTSCLIPNELQSLLFFLLIASHLRFKDASSMMIRDRKKMG